MKTSPIESPSHPSEDRPSEILLFMKEKGTASIAEMAAQFSVSEMTVRCALHKLADAGLVIRTPGGAMAAPSGSMEKSFLERSAKVRLTGGVYRRSNHDLSGNAALDDLWSIHSSTILFRGRVAGTEMKRPMNALRIRATLAASYRIGGGALSDASFIRANTPDCRIALPPHSSGRR